MRRVDDPPDATVASQGGYDMELAAIQLFAAVTLWILHVFEGDRI
jgi:hypothetical protein